MGVSCVMIVLTVLGAVTGVTYWKCELAGLPIVTTLLVMLISVVW